MTVSSNCVSAAIVSVFNTESIASEVCGRMLCVPVLPNPRLFLSVFVYVGTCTFICSVMVNNVYDFVSTCVCHKQTFTTNLIQFYILLSFILICMIDPNTYR